MATTLTVLPTHVYPCGWAEVKEDPSRRLHTVPTMNDFEPDRYKWAQIADIVRERIASGEYGPKFLISELSLVQEFGVARDTVRKTMQALRDEGLIYTVRGLGSFVSPAGPAAEDGDG